MKRVVTKIVICNLFALAIANILTCNAFAIPLLNQVAVYEKKVRNQERDLLDLARSMTGDEQEIVIHLQSGAHECSLVLGHLLDLLLIYDLIRNQEDKRRVRPIIRENIKYTIRSLNTLISQVNLGLAHISNQAVLNSAEDLRSEMRAVQEILQESGW